MLKNLLDNKKCFKLICGAGNENLQEVERLVALYAAAGCHFFDLSTSEEVLIAAQKGLDFAIPKELQKDYQFCVSIGTKGDQHMQKARIDSEKCTGCGECVKECPQGAIIEVNTQKSKETKHKTSCTSTHLSILESNCIGCFKCQKVCNSNAIKIKSDKKNYASMHHCIFTSKTPIECIELHISDTDEKEVDELWQSVKDFDGFLSICIDRGKLGNEQILNRIKRLIKGRAPYSVIIQADGAPMSGGKDGYKTTLQAIAMAEIIQNENLPVYILLSGGTNSKTAELAKLCEIDSNGISIGSYARKIVKEYIEKADFFENESVFNNALKIARKLVKII